MTVNRFNRSFSDSYHWTLAGADNSRCVTQVVVGIVRDEQQIDLVQVRKTLTDQPRSTSASLFHHGRGTEQVGVQT
jgi:hypothetical protein